MINIKFFIYTQSSVTAYVFETAQTETKNITRNPSIPETLAVAKLAAPAISQINHIRSVDEMKKSVAINVTIHENEDSNRSSVEGYTSLAC